MKESATKLSLVLSLLLLLAGVDGAYAAPDTSAGDGLALEAQDSSSLKASVEEHDDTAFTAVETDATATPQLTTYSLPARQRVLSQTSHHTLIRAPPHSSFPPISIR